MCTVCDVLQLDLLQFTDYQSYDEHVHIVNKFALTKVQNDEHLTSEKMLEIFITVKTSNTAISYFYFLGKHLHTFGGLFVLNKL